MSGHGASVGSAPSTTFGPITHASLMPSTIAVAEFRHDPTHADATRGHTWHTIPVDAATIEAAREGTVTVGVIDDFGEDAHPCESDLTPEAAEQPALRPVRRAQNLRTARHRPSEHGPVEASRPTTVTEGG